MDSARAESIGGPGPIQNPAIIEQGHQLQSFKYTYLTGLIILYFDYLLTFNAERRFMWKRRRGWVAYLFILNRYYTMLAYIVTTAMIFLPRITHPMCVKLGDFLPFGTGIPTLLLSGLLVSARVIAVYGGNKKIAAFLVLYLVAQGGATLWAFLSPGAGPLPLPNIKLDAFEACIQLTSPRLGNASVVWIAMDCGFDTIIITLTMIRSYQIYSSVGRIQYVLRKGDGSRPTLLATLVQDGFLYFLVLITLNVTWMIMVIAAPPGLKWICALPSQCVIVTMVSRITLNLRAQVYGSSKDSLSSVQLPPEDSTETGLTFSKPTHLKHLRERERERLDKILESDTEMEMEMEMDDMVQPRRIRDDWGYFERGPGECSRSPQASMSMSALVGVGRDGGMGMENKAGSRSETSLPAPEATHERKESGWTVDGMAI